MNKNAALLLTILLAMSLLGACGTKTTTVAQPTSQSTSQSASVEQPVAPEKNPPGDIPDTQAFVTYVSQQGHYSVEVPEGWARTETGSDVSFVDKLDGVSVTVTDASSAPTAASAKAEQLAQMAQAGHAVEIQNVQEVQLPVDNAIRADFTANSEKDAVTGKQVRLEEVSYLFFKDGKLATLTLWAPQGADNVDQWKRMSESFQWQ